MNTTIGENLTNVRKKIATAAGRAGRRPEEIRLVAVSKRMSWETVREAASCGQVLFGENYVQEAVAKMALLPPLPQPIAWHFIGHLQSNKARLAADHFQVIETVDRLKLAKALDSYLAERGRQLTILIQVNTDRETKTSGVLPEACEELLRQVSTCPQLKVAGLMTMPPYAEDPEENRANFRLLKQLAYDFAARGLLPSRPELSMGMSGDFEVAIEEGATLVRVGTAIFGSRA
ncbi:MAG: YggS family pyridoxal phosphate enzyme [Deltaproteobacteria bacterium RIFOXYD12_FULL_57_12]|nr:MAG: YggS family pyridoxal phosphate enzyme [Deltaproteobacteria bacterium RIFOXYD12_FULL_57_12]